MYRITTEIDIDASPLSVWRILTDFPSYPDWNPYIRRVDGEPVQGARLTIVLTPPSGRRFSFRPRVTACVENRELRWNGRLAIPGLFDGEHFFEIDSSRPGCVRLTHGENFSGVLVPLFRPMLDGVIRAGFVEMNQALKSRAEHG